MPTGAPVVRRGQEIVLMLLGSVAVLGCGPLLYSAAGRFAGLRRPLDGAVVISVGVVVVAQILPETFEHAGWVASLPLLAGLLGPTLAERALSRLESQTHRAVLAIVVVGLAAHAVVDGVALTLPGQLGTDWHVLPAAVILHRVPTSLVVWRFLASDGRSRRGALALGVIALATVIGWLAGDAWLSHLHGPEVGLFQAFVAGSLLHVVVHGLHPAAHRHDHGTT